MINASSDLLIKSQIRIISAKYGDCIWNYERVALKRTLKLFVEITSWLFYSRQATKISKCMIFYGEFVYSNDKSHIIAHNNGCSVVYCVSFFFVFCKYYISFYNIAIVHNNTLDNKWYIWTLYMYQQIWNCVTLKNDFMELILYLIINM